MHCLLFVQNFELAELILATRQISRQLSKVSSASLRSCALTVSSFMSQTIRSRINPLFFQITESTSCRPFPDDQTQPFEMTPGFKPFTVVKVSQSRMRQLNPHQVDSLKRMNVFQIKGGQIKPLSMAPNGKSLQRLATFNWLSVQMSLDQTSQMESRTTCIFCDPRGIWNVVEHLVQIYSCFP